MTLVTGPLALLLRSMLYRLALMLIRRTLRHGPALAIGSQAGRLAVLASAGMLRRVLYPLSLRMAQGLLRHGPRMSEVITQAGRSALRSSAGAATLAARLPALPATIQYCGQCGSSASSGVEFCPGCGLLLATPESGLSGAILTPCPDCGLPSDAKNYFCTACGTPWTLSARAHYLVTHRPQAVNIASAFHALAGVGIFALTLPVDLITGLALVGHPVLSSWLGGAGLLIGLAIGMWGIFWLAFSLLIAHGLRQAQPWARSMTAMVALLWCFTGLGAFVAIPLMIALSLPNANAYFRVGRSRPGALPPRGPLATLRGRAA